MTQVDVLCTATSTNLAIYLIECMFIEPTPSGIDLTGLGTTHFRKESQQSARSRLDGSSAPSAVYKSLHTRLLGANKDPDQDHWQEDLRGV